MLIEGLHHLRCHLGSFSKPVVHQRALVQSESELFVIWVLTLKLLYHFQVLGKEGLTLVHTGGSALYSIQ